MHTHGQISELTFLLYNNIFLFFINIQAIERLNLRTHNLRDLLTDEKFSRSDLITLQDPEHPETWDVSTFYHVKNQSGGKK